MADLLDAKFIGENIRYVRKRVMNKTQEEFAEITGLSKDTISNIERGGFLPSMTSSVDICNKTETSIIFLLSQRAEET